jgi:iron complex outermembrane receptor protein
MGGELSKFSALAIAILACSSSLVAAETLTLDNELENVTEIATKTKVNADYVPGAVTIIKGKDLKALGITNLAETNAFDMIVGFDSSVKSLRGSGSIYGSQGNKIKWMINDKPISSEIWGNGIRGVGPIAFPIPVDAVDRIEIISGPGSSLYGENAIYGVVNIITKKDQNGVYSTLARNENDKYGIAVGGFTNYNKDDLNINLHVSSFSDDGWNLKVGTNGNYYNSVVAAQTPGNGPGNLPSNREGRVVMADIDYKNWSFWAYRLENKSGYA